MHYKTDLHNYVKSEQPSNSQEKWYDPSDQRVVDQ